MPKNTRQKMTDATSDCVPMRLSLIHIYQIADLTDRFETRKRVDRAKGLLMKNMGMSEPEAFRWIQKTSMDRRLSMREVADAVINQVDD